MLTELLEKFENSIDLLDFTRLYNMKFNYYNLDDGWFEKKQSGWEKKKIFSIIFPNSNILESIQFENSDRGYLLWITTPKTVRVFGFWSNDIKASSCKKFYQKWNNDHCGC